MFSRKDLGGGSDGERFSEALSTLKRQGATMLVVGSVRPEQRRDVSGRLLGETGAQPRRRVLVETTGETHDASRLLGDESREDATTLVRYATHARSTASAAGSNDSETVSPSVGDSPITTTTLADLGIAISTAIEEFETDTNGMAPAELRVGIDSLVPLLEEYGSERVFKFVHLTNGRTRDVDGMIHYHLPMDRDADVVSVLTPLFDVVIELREHDDRYQERWTITDGDHSSGWLSVAQS